ncbi:hypothetical protein ABW20_dc0107039 [Dactylellina cionopaga]|nr:hypothetical protein ABW20_dc0107039 [Dactylellina cionopaga]
MSSQPQVTFMAIITEPTPDRLPSQVLNVSSPPHAPRLKSDLLAPTTPSTPKEWKKKKASETSQAAKDRKAATEYLLGLIKTRERNVYPGSILPYDMLTDPDSMDLWHPTYICPTIFKSADEIYFEFGEADKIFGKAMHNALLKTRFYIAHYRKNIRLVTSNKPKVHDLLFGKGNDKGPLDPTLILLGEKVRKHTMCIPTKKTVQSLRNGADYSYTNQREVMRVYIESSFRYIERFTKLWKHMNKMTLALTALCDLQKKIDICFQQMGGFLTNRRLNIDYLQIIFEAEYNHILKIYRGIVYPTAQEMANYTQNYTPAMSELAGEHIATFIRAFNDLFEDYWKSPENPDGLKKLVGGEVPQVFGLRIMDVHETLRLLAKCLKATSTSPAPSRKRKAETSADVPNKSPRRSPTSKMKTLEKLVISSCEMERGILQTALDKPAPIE